MTTRVDFQPLPPEEYDDCLPMSQKHVNPIHFSDLNLISWNCRGISNAIPYLHELSVRADIIFISEHWMWPYNLSKLDYILPGFSGMGCSDERLNDTTNLKRGCGGVAFLWKSSLPISFISGIDSDRISAIKISVGPSETLTIIGVYLPTADSTIDKFTDYLIELEKVISSFQGDGPVLVVGDFNAHIGVRGGIRGTGDGNVQGQLVMDMVERAEQYVVSLSQIASGPMYTYFQNDVHTTVDYCLLDHWAADMIGLCATLNHHSLNLSDHLPLHISLDIQPLRVTIPDKKPCLNWGRAIREGSVNGYMSDLSLCLSKQNKIETTLQNADAVEEEIIAVSQLIRNCALNNIPLYKSRKKAYVCDEKLKKLCKHSKAAWKKWESAGRPRSGPLFMTMKECKRQVKTFVSECRAKSERKEIQKRDLLFKNKDNRRFHRPKKHFVCQKLHVNGKIVTNREELLQCWKKHFTVLSISNSDTFGIVDTNLEALSHGLDDQIMDVEFTFEEVEDVVKQLKTGKSAGADGLQPEHLKYGGPALVRWLLRIFNAISKLEEIPSSLKLSMITPVFKGKGRDPLEPNNYRGISVTSILSKCLETAILLRLEPLFMERDFPSPSQSAYRKGVSCLDAIFTTQEAILKRMRDGDEPYLCFFDLEKAFDSIEYGVLLRHMFNLGINGKCWRLIKDWYSDSCSVVKIGDQISARFPLSRGVKQGSVLSPTLFNIVINSLLEHLKSTGQGISVSGLEVGSTAHADDIRAASCSVDGIQLLGQCVNTFACANSLKLNSGKTELVHFSRHHFTPTIIDIAGDSIQSQPKAKCLGVWWQHNLSPGASVDESISKARRAFFALGSIGFFQGNLNPLSSKSLFESFVIPTLLYGCETWILTLPLLNKLEKFQSEIGRRILGLSKYHADMAPLIGLHLPSITSRILIRKLNFLSSLLESDCKKLSACVFRTLAAEDVQNISLVQQIRWLENEVCVTSVIDKCLAAPETARTTAKSSEQHIIDLDWSHTMSKAASYLSLKHVISSPTIASSWCRMWDQALDHGVRGTKLFQSFFRCLTKPLFGDRLCHVCKSTIPTPMSFFEHLCSSHIEFDSTFLPSILEEGGSELFHLAQKLPF